MEKAYSKRELDMKFKSAEEKNDAWSATILEKLEDLDKYKLTPTLEQAKITNGRVNKHDRRWVWLTGCAFIFVPIFVVVAGWLIKGQLSTDQKIQTAVDDKFAPYEIQQSN